ncbi:SAM-dependent methyltransferase [Thermocatellispora tengchongensis]|uniref:SAM-dependent methyltransferase n=1 Tax=Thermocatellispora tengchongensis TaxID=1073253 RepID=A0A840P639_9ACTN|nr:class I SAM-dependent methyltransferase [Thermocatellispora tengchongensis]MBB5134459.1 SAM-dependent methyltransferase [Thermocatellispora tengchongensis]
MDARFWDEKYSGTEQVWSGEPNGVLVVEVTGMPPGRALDLGCGEGGDAIWLARQGWRVTGVDVSRVALERAAARAASLGLEVEWAQADLTAEAPPAGPYDLVSAHYFPLLRQDGHAALRRLLDTVAPGGTLLVASHDLAEVPADHGHGHGFDPHAFYEPHEIAMLLGDGWTIEVDETRPRVSPAPPGTQHTRDTVMRARRRR